ncbi:FAD-dependent oxidoreductase [Christensenellaceae bacterium OttesenSCG-928-L17]|nr:FAD-dependent oxidoreductase [Christensenellaceae bacterium OttesenSCG-928-L17]
MVKHEANAYPADDHADVLVVGSGAAAFSGAITARKNGATVIMLEKAETIGGTTARSGGGFWIPLNKWQRAAGYQDNREDALRYMARYSYPHLYVPQAERYGIPENEYELLEAHVDNGYKMVEDFDDWGALQSMMEVNWTGKGQVDYQDHLPENKGIRGRSIYPQGEDGKIALTGVELIRQLERWARNRGVQIVTGAEVTEILKDAQGRVNGLRVRINGQEQVYYANKGIIFGSGGYSHNADYMRQFQRGPHYGGCAVPTNTGDFIRMGGTIGAKIGNTAGAFRAQSMIEAYLQNPGGSANVFYLLGDSMIVVNKYGKRIMNEKRNYTDRAMVHFVWNPLQAEWTNMLMFMLFDERTATLWQGFPPFPVAGTEMPYLIKADSLEDLTSKISKRLEKIASHTGGFSLSMNFLSNLKKTIARFNSFASTGIDADFHRGETAYDLEWTSFPPVIPNVTWPGAGAPNYTMHPIVDTGTYYAIILAAGTLDTNGGPVINKHAQVLDWNGNPISGLYGAGNCIASPTANAYWGGGSTIGPALTFGYIAGNHILGNR